MGRELNHLLQKGLVDMLETFLLAEWRITQLMLYFERP